MLNCESSTMERASRLVRKLQRLKLELSDEELARRAWPIAVGEKIARYTRPLQLQNGCLIVEVNDRIWKHQLQTLRDQILKNLTGLLGENVVTGLRFQLQVPRRMPARASWRETSAEQQELPVNAQRRQPGAG